MSRSTQQGEGARPGKHREPFPRCFRDLVVFLLLSPAPNFVVRRLGRDERLVCTNSAPWLPSC